MKAESQGPFEMKTVAVFCAPTSAEDAAMLMRRAVAALTGTVEMDFFNEKDRLVFERADGLAPEWTNKPVFLTDTASSYAVLLAHFWEPETRYHYLQISPDSEIQAVELALEWSLLTARAERLLAATKPDIAVSFAQLSSAESDPIHYGEICDEDQTRILTSWTYFGAGRLDEKTRKGLTNVSGISTRIVGEGMLIIAAATPGTPQPLEVAQALSALGNVKYVDPLVTD